MMLLLLMNVGQLIYYLHLSEASLKLPSVLVIAIVEGKCSLIIRSLTTTLAIFAEAGPINNYKKQDLFLVIMFQNLDKSAFQKVNFLK